jgi:hypothetical protein
MSNIVQQTNVNTFGNTITCPVFGSTVIAGHAIVLVSQLFPISLAAENSPSISDGTTNVYKLAKFLPISTDTSSQAITFTAPPSGTSGTLAANWTGATANTIAIFFSDGEIRKGNFTNGSNAVNWVTAIVGTPSANAQTYFQDGLAIWLCANNVGGTVTPKGVTSGGGFSALYGAEITNVGTGNILLGVTGNVQFGPGTSPNAINAGTITVNQNAVLFGFCFDNSAVTITPISGGTGFNAQPLVWNNGTVNTALAEDATINTSTAVTFTAVNSADTYFSLGMALAGPGPFTPFTQTQFFVTDTIIQQ